MKNITAKFLAEKWPVKGFIGCLCLLFLFSGCQKESIQLGFFSTLGQNLLFSKASVFSDVPEKNSQQGNIPKISEFHSWESTLSPPKISVYGGIISSDTKLAEQLLEKIPDKNLYQTVVLLASTLHAMPENKIFTYDQEGTLAAQHIQFDQETIKKLNKGNLVYSLGAVSPQSFWNGGTLPLLQKYFPNARFIPISISDKATSADAEITAYVLHSYLPESSIIFALADFEETSNGNLQKFQKKFTHNVIENFDASKFDELPLKNSTVLQTLSHYLRFEKARKTQSILSVEGDLQALFSQGEQNINRTVFFVSFGDIMLGRDIRSLMNIHGLDYPFIKMDQNYLKVNDFLIANLEGPIAKNAIQTSKTIAFRFLPDVAPLLKKYYFDVLSLANNHALDMGWNGYNDTRQLLQEQSIIPFGNPRQIEEQSIAKLNIQGQKIAFLGLEEVTFTIDDTKALEKIKELTTEGYKVIPYIHWGIEYTHKPNNRQQDLAHKCIDAGAVAVIAHHPHVVQAYETYNGRPILYSLGNAVFDQYWSEETQVGLSVAMSINDQHIELYLIPIKIDHGQMRLMTEEESRVFLEKMATYGEYSENEKQAILKGKIVLPIDESLI